MATLKELLKEVNVEIIGPKTVHFNNKDYDVSELPPATRKVVSQVLNWAKGNIKAFVPKNLEAWDIVTTGDNRVIITSDAGRQWKFRLKDV